MTLRVPLSELREGERTLAAEAARYVVRVHRLGIGDRFVAFDPAARLEADVEMVSLGKQVVVRIEGVREATRVARREVCVVQALGKGTKLDAVVRDATELGATRIVPAVADRSVKRRTDLERLRRVALEAARQCGRGDVPVVEAPLRLATALEELGGGVVLHPEAPEGLGAVLRDLEGGVAIAIGPEGGLSDEELAVASASGWRLARLGAFVMRTETACAAALGAVACWMDAREA